MKSEAEIRAALAEMHDWADTRLVEAEDRNGEREIPKAPTPDYHYGYDAGMAEVFRCVSNRLENIIKGGDAACLTRTTRSNQDLSTDRGPHPVEKHAHIRSLAAQPASHTHQFIGDDHGHFICSVCGYCDACGKVVTKIPHGQPTPATVDAERKELCDRIGQYLEVGGLWNPEHMEHDKVRQLLMDIRAALLSDEGKR